MRLTYVPAALLVLAACAHEQPKTETRSRLLDQLADRHQVSP